MNQILVFSSFKNDRLLFVLDFIFNGFTTISFKVTEDELIYKRLEGGKINYSDSPICLNEIQIVPNGLLEEKGHRNFVPAIRMQAATPILFPVSSEDDSNNYHFDIFSAIFYMLSRYEEYKNPVKDIFGRFPAKESVAFKHNFLHLPIVDIWLKDFLQLIVEKNLMLSFPEKKMQVNFTYDIDVAYAYKGRSFARQLGAIGKDLLHGNFGRQITRFRVLRGFVKDPFNNYDYMVLSGINPIFFFLLHDKLSPQDRNIRPQQPILQSLIKRIQQQFPIGIHPSYFSSTQTRLLQSERETLQQISGLAITKSRQHYLRFSWPNTYQQLAQNGILEEYSMGFAETPGFRAGTSTPFYFYDLDKEEATEMKIFPLCIMETIFRDDLIIPVQKALNYFIEYYEAVKAVNGHFISVWHNDTLVVNKNEKDPRNFRWLHDQIVRYIRSHKQ